MPITGAALLLLLLAAPLHAEDAVATAAQAAADLQSATQAMVEAEGARDRVAALTATIGAYEDGLEALREALRQAAIREAALQLRLDAERDRIAQLLGVLATLDAETGPLLLLHPAGALSSARSGMMLAEVAPALRSEVAALRAELEETGDLRRVQEQAEATLSAGLGAAQSARSALARAMADRGDLPRRFTEDPAEMKRLLESADTLAAFADGLLADPAPAAPGFAGAKGSLPLPVRGAVLRRAGEADAAGIRRPGVLLATQAGALVTAPAAATIRYAGPLLDYGNVMVLEPGDGYLLIFAGLESVYGDVGQVVAPGEALGLMGAPPAGDQAEPKGGSATLYVELRQGAETVDPAGWFEGMQEQDGSR